MANGSSLRAEQENVNDMYLNEYIAASDSDH